MKAGFIQPNWQKNFQIILPLYVNCRVSSTKRQPKNIRDWNDLTKPGVEIITPNPKTGGAPRWIYLSAWGYALKQPGGNDVKARELVKSFITM